MEAGLLDPAAAVVGMIDVQENHYPHVVDGEGTLDRLVRFLRAVRILEVPVVWVEQYPRGFGPTLAPIRDALAGLSPIAKTSFGAWGEPRFAAAVEETGRGVLYLVGAETHVCVEQTALAARARGLEVVVLADCVTARAARDHAVALDRMAREGVVLSTWEAVLYEWMRDASHPCFKQVLSIVKGS